MTPSSQSSLEFWSRRLSGWSLLLIPLWMKLVPVWMHSHKSLQRQAVMVRETREEFVTVSWRSISYGIEPEGKSSFSESVLPSSVIVYIAHRLTSEPQLTVELSSCTSPSWMFNSKIEEILVKLPNPLMLMTSEIFDHLKAVYTDRRETSATVFLLDR